jgi:hypothetical protein
MGLPYIPVGDAGHGFDPALVSDGTHTVGDLRNAVKLGGYVPVSHEALCDYTDHVCTADCPPPYVPPPVPFRRRARYALRRCWWWVTGLRVAHRSRIDQDGDD